MDAMGESGVLTIVGRNEGEQVVVEVSDTGVGISPENLPKIFEPFFTMKSSGFGLGLSISYDIIRQHMGEILVESIPEKGVTFTVWLPLAPDEEDGQEA